MNKKLKTLLNTLSQDQLIAMINDVYECDRNVRPVIEQFIAAYDPKELYKIINKKLTAIKKSTRFIDYYESAAFSEELERINTGIEQLIPQDPQLALKLCQRFIEIDGHICNRVDDSNGFLQIGRAHV